MCKTIVIKNKVGDHILYAFETYYKATIIMRMGISIRRDTENRIELKNRPVHTWSVNF